jgi:hypothetical protein
MPLAATDWHFMTREEICEHEAAEEIEIEPNERGVENSRLTVKWCLNGES